MPPWKESREAMLTMAPDAAAPEHRAAEGLGQEEDSLEVDLHDLVPVFLGEIEGVGAPDDPGTVDQDVDVAGLGHQLVDGAAPGEIDHDRAGAPARSRRCA